MTSIALRPTTRLLSAGRALRLGHHVVAPASLDDCRAALAAVPPDRTILPFGGGQSLGDSCLNGGGVLVATGGMDRILGLDRARGTILCEPGVTLGRLADMALDAPPGERRFPAVLPGTTRVTVAGAIANDVHGKNHRTGGSFAHHVESLTLMRSDGRLLVCSDGENRDLFRATLGGLGLTGLIVSATLRLRPVPGPALETEDLRLDRLDAAFPLFDASATDWEYCFFWFDPFDPAGRGIFRRARHASEDAGPVEPASLAMRILSRLPFPGALGGPHLWRARHRREFASAPARHHAIRSYRDSLAPLGAFPYWNRLLGPRGLFHMQSVLPTPVAAPLLASILGEARRAGEPPCLASIKWFGPRPAAGLLSFPREGVTLAADFANAGDGTRRLLGRVEAMIVEAGGAIYPAKDSTLSPTGFRRSFPALAEFRRHVDPRFSSSLWRRVNAAG